MSDPSVPSDTSKLSLTRLLTAAGFLGLIAVILGLVWKLNNAAPVVQTENVELKKQLANMEEMLADLKRAEQLRAEQDQIRRSDLQVIVATTEEAMGDIAALEQAIQGWQRTNTELLTGDRGRPIAAHEDSLRQFQALRDQGRPAETTAETLRRRIEPLKVVVDRAVETNDPNYAPSEDVAARIQAIGAEAEQARTAYDEANRKLAALIAAAPAPTGPLTQTLQHALDTFEQRLAAEETAAIAAAIERERQNRAEQLAREKAESERQITSAQLEAERIRREAETKRLADEKELAAIQAKQEEEARQEALRKADLERRFQAALPEIQSLLVPFITEGFTQPGRNSFEAATTKKTKVSLGKIKGAGLLDDTPFGVYRLVTSSVYNSANDRPLGAFPNYATTDYSAPWFTPAQRAQELLREFGEIMVEKGMLEP